MFFMTNNNYLKSIFLIEKFGFPNPFFMEFFLGILHILRLFPKTTSWFFLIFVSNGGYTYHLPKISKLNFSLTFNIQSIFYIPKSYLSSTVWFQISNIIFSKFRKLCKSSIILSNLPFKILSIFENKLYLLNFGRKSEALFQSSKSSALQF